MAYERIPYGGVDPPAQAPPQRGSAQEGGPMARRDERPKTLSVLETAVKYFAD